MVVSPTQSAAAETAAAAVAARGKGYSSGEGGT